MLLSRAIAMLSGMKTKLAAGLSALALAVPVADAAAATRATSNTTAKKTVTRKVSGVSAAADRWGDVTINVTATITTGANGKKTIKYTNLGGSYSYHTDR